MTYMPGLRVFNVRDYGAVGDGAADDLPAFGRALQAMAQENILQRLPDIPGLSFRPGATLHVPIGRYRLTDHLEIDRGINLEGVSGALESSGSILRFDGGKSLIVNTQHISSAHTSGGASTSRNLRIDARNKVADNHGIILRGRAYLEQFH